MVRSKSIEGGGIEGRRRGGRGKEWIRGREDKREGEGVKER